MNLFNKPLAQLDTLRSRIADINAELDQLESESLSEKEVHDRIDGFISQKASQFDDGAGSFLSHGTHGIAAGFFSDMGRATTDHQIGADVSPILCAIFPDQVKQYLVAVIKEKYGDRFGRPMADRPAIRAELEAERYTLEVQEEQLIQQSEASGAPIDRRIDFENVLLLIIKDDAATELAA